MHAHALGRMLATTAYEEQLEHPVGNEESPSGGLKWKVMKHNLQSTISQKSKRPNQLET